MRATSPATGTPPRGRPNTSRGSGNRSSTPASTRRQPSTCPAWRRFRNRDPLALRAIALLPAGLREPALQLLGKIGEVAADVDERELRQDRRRRLPLQQEVEGLPDDQLLVDVAEEQVVEEARRQADLVAGDLLALGHLDPELARGHRHHPHRRHACSPTRPDASPTLCFWAPPAPPPGLRRAPPSVGFAHNRPWPVWTWDYHFRGWVRRWRCQSVPSSSLPTRSSPSR